MSLRLEFQTLFQWTRRILLTMQPVYRSLWAMLIFVLGVCTLIVLVSNYFLFPAMLATVNATTAEKQRLSAVATLLLAIVLLIVGVGLVLVLRVKRFFIGTTRETRVKTDYIDAWAESAKRAKTDDL